MTGDGGRTASCRRGRPRRPRGAGRPRGARADVGTRLRRRQLRGARRRDRRAGRAAPAAARSRSPRRSSACASPTPARAEVDGRPRRAGQRAGALDGRRRLRPAGPAPRGLSCPLSIAENADDDDRRPARAGRLRRPARRDGSRAPADRRSSAIKTAGPTQPVAALSGGNQQKVVMARALADGPASARADQPDRGRRRRAPRRRCSSVVQRDRADWPC